ncbi:MAG: Radical domain protein [Ignavibacteria bacterium]|nr:Radical domain protein [Ignavibacteria bacterium]
MITDILEKNDFSAADLAELISAENNDDIEFIRNKAYEVMRLHVGEEVYYRGLIEFSNICTSDCYYCGIRKSNTVPKRYTLTKEEILTQAKWCAGEGYGSLVLQSGERNDERFIEYLEEIITSIKNETKSVKLPDGLGVTLCVGEQTANNYKRLFDAGAHRYLLRIETTNRELFEKIHPETQSFDERVNCLKLIKEAGFQLGTGVMIGIPGQTALDLANDLLFFRNMDVDMIGMGPFLANRNTPMYIKGNDSEDEKQKIYRLSLKMIAVARIFLKDVNIASTTALQAMYPFGREEGLRYGANILMPQLTPTEYRKDYQLYDGKPCIDEDADDCAECLEARVKFVGRQVAFDSWGDSKHFKSRVAKSQ